MSARVAAALAFEGMITQKEKRSLCTLSCTVPLRSAFSRRIVRNVCLIGLVVLLAVAACTRRWAATTPSCHLAWAFPTLARVPVLPARADGPLSMSFAVAGVHGRATSKAALANSSHVSLW